MILLVGPPGSGKSTFCHRTVLNNITIRPTIYVTTESGPSKVTESLQEMGLSETSLHSLGFVDAFHETVGLPSPARPDVVGASCGDLTGLSMAISKLQERMRENVLLVFDSLTSPYLLSGPEVVRFMRLTLSKFAAEGNSVLACFDEGSGKEEDLVAMMSLSDGVMKMEREEDKLLLNIVKHPKVRPTRIEIPMEPERVELKPILSFDPSVMRPFIQSFFRPDEPPLRRDLGDFVNLFWPNLAHWSCMLWDPKRFPRMIYDLNKEEAAGTGTGIEYFPWRMRLLIKFMPKNFSKVKDMKKMVGRFPIWRMERSGIMEYLEDISKTDEHHIRIYECSDCWGLENVGATIASHLPPMFAGALRGFEKEERDWNAVETKCIAMGDPYCEFKLVPGEIDELKSSLEKDSSVIERIHERLIQRLMGFLLDAKPLVETRPRLGSDVHLHVAMHAMGFPHVAGERYRTAQRMGGAKSGKEIGERLMDAGMREDEAVKGVLHLLEYCRVGKVSMDETIRMKENVESLRTLLFATERREPCCYFTTGFLNGFFSAVKNTHVKETKCVVLGDAYCEWEFR
jgi:predicted hydrocarbon binding protein/KaiC/GvpD/RAD55 family RecA-like ATPase